MEDNKERNTTWAQCARADKGTRSVRETERRENAPRGMEGGNATCREGSDRRQGARKNCNR